MKMNEMARPTAFLQGLSQYSYEEMLHGLSWVNATNASMMMGLRGLGQVDVDAVSTMDAIIRNAAEMHGKQALVEGARKEIAKRDPMFASKLRAASAKTAQPGTNEARAVQDAMDEAARKAMKAKQEEQQAKQLLAQGDKRGAAAKTTNALTSAREAATLANRAEKTRLTRSLDTVAKTLDAQAKYVEDIARNETARSGNTPRVSALMASAQSLSQQASQLRAQSAVVAQAPEVPANAPSQKRIAEVSNKFNVRCAGKGGVSNATMSVLSDLAESPLAQVKDYDGAVMFYGNDGLGRLMADMEFDNARAAFSGIAGHIHGLGRTDVIPAFAQAQQALDRGVRAAQSGFTTAVVPAMMGAARNLKGMQSNMRGLSGLSALGEHKCLFLEDPTKCATRTASWDRACQAEYGPEGKTPDAEQLDKCWNPKIPWDAFEPWEAVGRAGRGNITIAQAVAQALKSAPAAIAQVAKNAPANLVPPAATLPPLTLPGILNAGAAATGMNSRFQQFNPTAKGSGALFTQLSTKQGSGVTQQQLVTQDVPQQQGGTTYGGNAGAYSPSASSTAMYAAVGGSALLVLGAAWYFMRRPAA